MNKSDIVSLSQDLTFNEITSNSSTRFFSDALESLCKSDKCPLVSSSDVTVTSGTDEYDFPSNCVKILGLFYRSAHLPYANREELEAYNKDWRDLSGTPFAYTIEDLTIEQYRLVPTPDESGTYGKIIYTNDRTTDIMTTIGLPLALDMIARDFNVPGNHQDMNLSKIAKLAAELIFKIGGIK